MDGHASRLTPYLWMLTSAAAFCCMSELAGLLNARCHWLIVATARASLAFVFAGCWAAYRRTRPVFFRPRVLWMRSIAGSCSLLCVFYALGKAPASQVIAVTNTFPIWVAVLSWPMLGSRPQRSTWFAVFCSTAGVALMQNLQLKSFNIGIAAAAASSMLTAVVVIGLKMLQGIPSQAIVIHFSFVATLFCLAAWPSSGLTAADVTALSPTTFGMLAAMGLAATVGQLFLTKAFAAGSTPRLSVVALSQIVLCLAFEFLFLERHFRWTTIAGMMAVIGPTVWMMMNRDAEHRTAPPVRAERPTLEDVQL